MIVISGALVLVALVLLVLGLTLQDLAFVYGSIGVSLVSFVFLILGIVQRRGEQPLAAADGPAVVEDTPGTGTGTGGSAGPVAWRSATPPAAAPQGQATAQPAADEPAADEPAADGPTVLVVPGRPRYHVAGCRYLAGRHPEQVSLEQARAQYSACGVCRPEEQFASGGQPDAEVVDSGVPGAEELDSDLQPEPVIVPARGRRPAGAAGTRGGTTAAAGTAGRTPRRRAGSVAVAEAAQPPDSRPAPSRRSRVVVIPDRGRYHTTDCRFVRDVLGTEELTRTQAQKLGFQPCGVCKP